MNQNKPIFIDRDGVINQFPGLGYYVTHKDEFTLLPAAREGIKKLYEAGYSIYVISNQAGVGKGLYSQADLDEINAAMREDLRTVGAELAGIYYCVHLPDEGCACRKPGSGLFKQAVGDDFDFTATFYIGDACTDIEAGHALGMKTILVLCGRTSPDEYKEWAVQPDFVAGDLLTAANIVINSDL